MSLYAVVSDVHGNLDALEAVLGEAESAGVDAVWCLGDVVDYGPSPGECVDLVRARCAVVLRGNHDLAVTGQTSLRAFNPWAAQCAIWSSDQLREDQHAWLRELPEAHVDGRVGCWHASPRDPVWEYVTEKNQAAELLGGVDQDLVLVGHTHVPCAFRVRADLPSHGADSLDLRRRVRNVPDVSDGTVLDLGEDRWLVNPGSVGLPRSGKDMRAQWGLLDTEGWTFTMRRTEYDRQATKEACRAVGSLLEPVARAL